MGKDHRMDWLDPGPVANAVYETQEVFLQNLYSGQGVKGKGDYYGKLTNGHNGGGVVRQQMMWFTAKFLCMHLVSKNQLSFRKEERFMCSSLHFKMFILIYFVIS